MRLRQQPPECIGRVAPIKPVPHVWRKQIPFRVFVEARDAINVTRVRVERDIPQEILAVGGSRKRAACLEHKTSPQEARDALEDFALAIDQVSIITTKQLITAIARKYDRNVLASHLRNDVGRYA